MGNRFAYVVNGVVLSVESRTENDTEVYPIGKYYHSALLPFFVEIRKGENAPNDKNVLRGWLFNDNQFREPQPFETNPETGEMYLPQNIPADMFWQVFQDNIQLKNDKAQLEDQVTNLQLAVVELYEGGGKVVQSIC